MPAHDPFVPFHKLPTRFRQNPTDSEALLWESLRGRRCGGLKFRRQQPMGRFIVDFFCAERRLVIEVDGPIHLSQRERDRQRQALLETTGLRFLRFTSEQVIHDLPTVLEAIRRFV
jgi:very-short-patch-repair endonuclease